MPRRSVTVCNNAGLHARPCHAVVAAARDFRAELRIEFGGRAVNGKSILELMTLNAPKGSELDLAATGADAEGLLEALEALFSSGFGEDLG